MISCHVPILSGLGGLACMMSIDIETGIDSKSPRPRNK